MENQITEAVQEFLIMLITGILGALGAFLIVLVKKALDWVGEKIDFMKNERQKSDLKEALLVLDRVVSSTVESLQQTLGDEIKESIKNCDGKYTEDDLKDLKEKAISMISNQLSASTVSILNGTVGSLKDFIDSLIESYIHTMKSSPMYLQESQVEGAVVQSQSSIVNENCEF